MKKYVTIKYGNITIRCQVVKVNNVEMVKTPAGFLVPLSHFKSR